MKQDDIKYLISLTTGGYYKKKLFRKVFPDYIKSGEDLFEFLDEVQHVRSFGQTIKKAVLNWIYVNEPDFIKEELCKSYKLFDGLTILRLFHPKPITNKHNDIFQEIKQKCLNKRKKDV